MQNRSKLYTCYNDDMHWHIKNSKYNKRSTKYHFQAAIYNFPLLHTLFKQIRILNYSTTNL